jgi:hypothetical protein
VTGARLAPSQVLDRIVIALGAPSEEQREWAEAWYRVGSHRQSARRRTGEAVVRDVVPHQLPPGVDSFVGRDEQLRELDHLLRYRDTGMIAALCGTAGVGKTALALHWAQTRAEHFPDGQIYLDLGGFDPEQPMPLGHALARMLRALGLSNRQIPREVDERAAQLRSTMAGRRMLVVLDNARDTEQVRALLPGPPSCTLVTSRDSLAGLVARHGAHRVELDVLPLADATELLRILIDAGQPASAGPVTLSTLATLADQCARLPLALRIAADVVCSHPATDLGDLIADLATDDHVLDLLDAGDDPRTGLRAVFSWSYRELPAGAARGFRLLGLYAGLEVTAATLSALLEVDGAEADRILRVLRQAHLVSETQPGRFATHALLRAYARELAAASDPEVVRSDALARVRESHLRAVAQPDRRGGVQPLRVAGPGAALRPASPLPRTRQPAGAIGAPRRTS